MAKKEARFAYGQSVRCISKNHFDKVGLVVKISRNHKQFHVYFKTGIVRLPLASLRATKLEATLSCNQWKEARKIACDHRTESIFAGWPTKK